MATRSSLRGKAFSAGISEKCIAELRRKLGDMEKRAPNVMANAMNQTLTQLKKHVSQRVMAEYTYKPKLEKPRIERASYKKQRARLIYLPIPFAQIQKLAYTNFDFKAGMVGSPRNTPGAQLEAKIRRDESFEKRQGAFQVNGMVLERKGRDRYPLHHAVGPGEPTMVRTVWRSEETQEFTASMLSKKLDEQINKQYLKKWGLK